MHCIPCHLDLYQNLVWHEPQVITAVSECGTCRGVNLEPSVQEQRRFSGVYNLIPANGARAKVGRGIGKFERLHAVRCDLPVGEADGVLCSSEGTDSVVKGLPESRDMRDISKRAGWIPDQWVDS